MSLLKPEITFCLEVKLKEETSGKCLERPKEKFHLSIVCQDKVIFVYYLEGKVT